MQLNYLSIGRKAIKFGVTMNPEGGESAATEKRNIVAHEAPLQELVTAYAKLIPVVCSILEVGEDWNNGLNVTRIAISYTKHGTRSVRFFATKQLDSRRGLLHRIDTPYVQIDKSADGESGEEQVTKKEINLILKAIHEAERYAKGERIQQLLDFDKEKSALQALADKGEDLLKGEA